MHGLMTDHLPSLLELVREAGQMALSYWRGDQGRLQVEGKADGTPVTEADRALSRLYVNRLPKVIPWPVVSEEGDLSLDPGPTYWLVDPIDGTKYFGAGEQDWVTMLAVIHKGFPIFGMIAHPLSGRVYWAGKGAGAFMLVDGGTPNSEKPKRISTSTRPALPWKTFSSGFHRKAKGRQLMASIGVSEVLSRGSALKFVGLAEGEAQLYPRRGPTGEWDTAPGQVLLEETGGFLLDLQTGKPMAYCKPGFMNKGFIAGHLVLLDNTLKFINETS